jgi:hypothetical protein
MSQYHLPAKLEVPLSPYALIDKEDRENFATMETSPQPIRGPHPLRKRSNRKPCKSGVYVQDVALQQLLRLTHLPSHQAAKALGLGITVRPALVVLRSAYHSCWRAVNCQTLTSPELINSFGFPGRSGCTTAVRPTSTPSRPTHSQHVPIPTTHMRRFSSGSVEGRVCRSGPTSSPASGRRRLARWYCSRWEGWALDQ